MSDSLPKARGNYCSVDPQPFAADLQGPFHSFQVYPLKGGLEGSDLVAGVDLRKQIA